MILRDYQTAAVDAVFRDFESVQSTLVTCPTGCGKTVIGAEIVRRIGGHGIWLAHRKELLEQAQATIEAHCGVETEFEIAGQHASEMYPAPVLFATVQTMIAGKNGTRRMNKFSPYNYDWCVCDEAHHYVAPMFRTVTDYLKVNKDCKFTYLTATPNRTDEEALKQVIDSCAYDYQVRQAIRDGWLVPVEQQLVNIDSLDFSHIRTTAGDLHGADLAAVMEAERNLYGMCDAAMKELKPFDKCIMFCASVDQAKKSADIFNRYRAGIALFVSGKTPPEDRARIFRDFREGRGGAQYFVNCGIAGEGVDIPNANKLIGGKPTKSTLNYQQMMGRVMRPLPGCVDDAADDALSRRAAIAGSAKPVATVMDFVGNAGRHKLIHAVDVLGGKITPSQRELVERKLKESGAPMQVDALVEEAEKMEREEKERQERARKARLTGRAVYTIRTINPFDAFDLIAPPERDWDRGKHLSTKQAALLSKQGIDPSRLTFAESRAIINELFNRWNNGLCSLRQAACLKRFGYETKGLTRDRASLLITELKANGWRKVSANA